MGTWGAGNFDNDSASDYIQDFCVPVMDQIRRHMSDENLMEVCEPDEDFSFANMEIMIRLADIYGFCEYADSEEQARIAEIAAWKTKYLNHYDQIMGAPEAMSEHERARRAVIADTFDRFERAVRRVQMEAESDG